MSRCFSYPRHLCSAKIAGTDTLIDSIKLRRDDSIAERKKERKGEKKVLKLSVKKEANEFFDQSRKRKHGEEKGHNIVDTKLCKSVEDSELLERSNLTEEYGQPYCPQIPCTSDSSEDSTRRKRHCPNTPPVSGIRAQGTILRIRLAPKKTATPIKEELQPTPTVTRNPVELRQANEPSTSERNSMTKLEKKIQRMDLAYKDLINKTNWVLPSLSSIRNLSDEDDELGWLNQKRGTQNVQRCKQPNSDSTGSTMWPQANFLPEANIYALPFTVPF